MVGNVGRSGPVGPSDKEITPLQKTYIQNFPPLSTPTLREATATLLQLASAGLTTEVQALTTAMFLKGLLIK